jgi:hypothetical protein
LEQVLDAPRRPAVFPAGLILWRYHYHRISAVDLSFCKASITANPSISGIIKSKRQLKLAASFGKPQWLPFRCGFKESEVALRLKNAAQELTRFGHVINN